MASARAMALILILIVTLRFDEAEAAMCPFCNPMTDALRTQILDMHNTRRSQLARGSLVDNRGTRLPPAKNMNKLIWDCALEESADRYIKNCPNGEESRRSDFQPGENFYRAPANSRCYEDFFDRAVEQWWDVYKRVDGPGAKTYFYGHHYNSPIRTYTQMAWSFTRSLGCSIRECNSVVIISCRYNEVGNRIDYPMYNKGPTCSECQRMTRCDHATGLCV